MMRRQTITGRGPKKTGVSAMLRRWGSAQTPTRKGPSSSADDDLRLTVQEKPPGNGDVGGLFQQRAGHVTVADLRVIDGGYENAKQNAAGNKGKRDRNNDKTA